MFGGRFHKEDFFFSFSYFSTPPDYKKTLEQQHLGFQHIPGEWNSFHSSMHSVLSAGLTNADLSHCIDSTEKNKLKKLKRAIKSCHYRRYKLVTVARLSAFLASYDWNTLLIMLSCLNACITFWLCFQPVAQQVLYRHPLLPSLS